METHQMQFCQNAIFARPSFVSAFQIVAAHKSIAYHVDIAAHNSTFGKTVARCQIWMFEEFFCQCSTI